MGDEGMYAGPSSTPEYDTETGLVYTLGADGDLGCWDARRAGRRVWGLNLYDTFRVGRRPRVERSGQRDYGYTSSPLVRGDWLLVEVGSPRGNLMAFAKRTGELLWASRNTDPAGHTSGPLTLDVQGVPCAVVLTHRNLLVVRLDPGHEGETLAEYPWPTWFANNIVAPTAHGSSLLLTAAYNHQSIERLEVTPEGLRRRWQRPFFSKVGSPVVHRGCACWAWQVLRCLDLETGDLRWEGGSFGDAGSIAVTSDGRFVIWGGQGRLALVEGPGRSPAAYVELARRDGLGGADAWPHVALASGRLYLRDREGLLTCIDLAPGEPAWGEQELGGCVR
jgi:outer membrane protein assembly factor BamB